MTVKPRFEDAQPIDRVPDDRAFLEDVWAGLAEPRKALPAKYFYDANGSELFETITSLPEYYPTRTELTILDRRGAEIAAAIPQGATLVEFGSGSTVKIRRLLRHLPSLAAYVPVDVSGAFLRDQAETLRADFPDLAIEPVVADFTKSFALPLRLTQRPKAGFFPGSTIGNFRPDEAVALLETFGTILGTGARLIVGIDLVKDRSVLEAAYDDAAGVTAAFNLNLLARINRELSGTFDRTRFSHRAVFDAQASRVEMHLVSEVRQEVRIGDRSFDFEAGESIHTENSYKYTIEGFRALAARAGWMPGEVWTDDDDLFSVHGLTRAG